jgi:RNA polymerase sigma factor (TIGR02999 family)
MERRTFGLVTGLEEAVKVASPCTGCAAGLFLFPRARPVARVAECAVLGGSLMAAHSTMNDVTCILSAIEQGDPHAAEQLLPMVYDELRRLAAAKMAHEKPGQTLQPTALVHEAYLRLVDSEKVQHWNSRGHFFAAAAEAMRRILIESARRKQSHKLGGFQHRLSLEEADVLVLPQSDRLLAIDDALDRLAAEEPKLAELVKLRIFAGLSVAEAAKALGVSRTTAFRYWTYARAWLRASFEDKS